MRVNPPVSKGKKEAEVASNETKKPEREESGKARRVSKDTTVVDEKPKKFR